MDKVAPFPSDGQRVLGNLVGDVIIDDLVQHLDVEDILALRRVNSQYKQCAESSIVWKRIIERTAHKLPPLPPTPRYSFARLTGLEAQRLVTRALSFPRQWDKDEGAFAFARTWGIGTAGRVVLEMALLPGGKYIVAAVADRTRTRFAVDFYTSDFGYRAGFPVARLPVEGRAFGLRARYATVRGRHGIVVGFVRRVCRHRRYEGTFDVNEIGAEEKAGRFASMVKYECAVVHIPLESIELLCEGDEEGGRPTDPRAYRTLAQQQPRPFQLLAEITSRAHISNVVVDEDVGGVPLVAVLKHPDRIVYKNLDGGPGRTMLCAPHPSFQHLPHTILAFTILPCQRQFLVVRCAGADGEDEPDPFEIVLEGEDEVEAEADNAPGPYYFAELYDIDLVDPAHGGAAMYSATAVSRSAVCDARGNRWERVWLSDHGLGPALANDQSLRAYLHLRRPWGAYARPDPVVLFVQSARTCAITYWMVFPQLVTPSSEGQGASTPRWRYVINEEDEFVTWNEDEAADEVLRELNGRYAHRVLPGSVRPIVYSVPRESVGADRFDIGLVGRLWEAALLDRARRPRVRGGADAGGGGGDEDEDGSEAEVEAEVGAGSEEGRYGETKLIRMGEEARRDVSAIAWDETIGRLCVAYADQARIAVFDCAGAPLRVG